jgi:hypothetical protein
MSIHWDVNRRAVLRYEAMDHDCVLLADAVCTVGGLPMDSQWKMTVSSHVFCSNGLT